MLHVRETEDMHDKILVGISDGKRPLRRPTRRWEDNITMNLQKVG